MKLQHACQSQSLYLSRQPKRVSHQGPGGNSFTDRARLENYIWTNLGENVADRGNVYDAFESWMKSPEHRENILNREFTMMGGYGGQQQSWVQMFGTSRSETCG